MTTVIVLQSTLRATWIISVQRIIGTALGAAVGALAAVRFFGNNLAFALAVFVTGSICIGLRLDKSAYRYAGITLAVVMLIPHAGHPWFIARHAGNPWFIAMDRFVEVSLGIAVGVAVTAVWPECDKVS